MDLETAMKFRSGQYSRRNPRRAFSAQGLRNRNDETTADRKGATKLHKYNDFWDTLVKDLNHIEKKAKGEAEDDEEENKDKKADRNSAFKVNQRTLWNESQEIACWKRRIRREKSMIAVEMKMAAKAALVLRQEALRQLLEKEQEMWENELSLLGIDIL